MMVAADNGLQFFIEEEMAEIMNMAEDRFINENRSLEYRYTDSEVCENYGITHNELERIKKYWYSETRILR